MKRGFLTLSLLLVGAFAAVPPARAQREERRAPRRTRRPPAAKTRRPPFQRRPQGRPGWQAPRWQERQRPTTRLREGTAPGASARVAAARPLPKPRPIADPKLFLNHWAPPPSPRREAAGGAAQPPALGHAAVFDHTAFVTNMLWNLRNEVQPNRYYWHHDGGFDYVHYYQGGAHWYGFYVGQNYYWTQYHGGRWWWYDPLAQRYVYYGDGSWWWQDPAQPQALYVYQNDTYVPYDDAAAAAEPGAPNASNNVVVNTAPAEPAAPRYHSDVDEPKYSVKPDPNRFALVIGVEDYAGLPRADFAARDAESVRAHLSALGYPDRNVVVLTNSQAARASVAKYVESWLPERVTGRSRVFVYFSGHGAPDPKTGAAYIMPWDGDAKYLTNTGYPLKQLYASLNALPAKDIVVVLDSCFSGLGGRSVLVAGARPLVTNTDVGRGSTGKAVVFSATGAEEITGTLPDQGHGLFTYYFLKGLNGEAAATADGVTVQALFDYLSPNVEDAARRDNRDQTPQLFVPPDGQRQLLIKDLR